MYRVFEKRELWLSNTLKLFDSPMLKKKKKNHLVYTDIFRKVIFFSETLRLKMSNIYDIQAFLRPIF